MMSNLYRTSGGRHCAKAKRADAKLLKEHICARTPTRGGLNKPPENPLLERVFSMHC